MEIPRFEYMRWAKRHAGAFKFDFSSSGVPSAVLPSVSSPAENREVPVGDGDPVVEGLLSDLYGVPADHVLFVPGTTLATFLLARLLVEPGDRVLVETPAYENLPGVVRLLGAEVVPVPRLRGEDYRVDLMRVDEGFRSGARLLMVTDLHNPSGVALGAETRECLSDLARRNGARVFVDEVYRDYVPGAPGTAYDANDPSLVVASSLTKVYGFGALRAGWVILPPEDRQRAAELLDWLTVLPPGPSARCAEHLLRNLKEFRPRTMALTKESRSVFDAWAAERGDVDCVKPAAGLIAFPAFDGIDDTGPLCDWLREERETLLVPGRFFGDPARVRMGCTQPAEEMEEGLARVAEGIDRFR